MGTSKLSEYRRKRNFRKTPEPKRGRRRHSKPRFVIQKHDASSLHYDFRLEVGNVLVSWAVPKGLSTDPRDKRLALRTEDHPQGYIDFEGVIPEGEYGAGAVMVWDAGTYRNLSEGEDMVRSLDDGLVKVWLDGEKLSGGYALKRTSGGDRSKWMMVKMKDKQADARRKPTKTEPGSVKTGRSLDEIAKRGRET